MSLPNVSTKAGFTSHLCNFVSCQHSEMFYDKLFYEYYSIYEIKEWYDNR